MHSNEVFPPFNCENELSLYHLDRDQVLVQLTPDEIVVEPFLGHGEKYGKIVGLHGLQQAVGDGVSY